MSACWVGSVGRIVGVVGWCCFALTPCVGSIARAGVRIVDSILRADWRAALDNPTTWLALGAPYIICHCGSFIG